ncbi:MAG TPA: AAA family ATPase [Pyrinomonadaceae bacterium]|nr:AAA family ATPase [Pyrinomonadaceae bacterium]
MLMLMVESADDTGIGKIELILDKIIIPSPRVSFCRRRLLDALWQSFNSCSSTVISGRAGMGKTTLALHFAELCRRDVAWYKVDAPETDLRIFLQYLIASIAAQRPAFGRGPLRSLLDTVRWDSPSNSELTLLAEAFVHELDCKLEPPLLIVIEDLHLVFDAEWLVPFFKRVLPLLPADVHMLITSRTMPPAPLWRMRSKQTLSVIDDDMLSFTRNEAVELFASYNLTHEQAAIAFDHSRGRPAALASLAATLHYNEMSDKGTAFTDVVRVT